MTPTKESVLGLIREGGSYEQAGQRFHVPAGLAYLIATGVPADGSDGLSAEELRREGMLPGSSQHLANPRSITPQRDEAVDAWMRQRAAADGAMREAARRHSPEPPTPREDPDDVVSVIGTDHNQVEHLEKELKATPGPSSGGTGEDIARRVELLGMIRTRLTRHEELEERFFWPFVRERVPGGAGMAERAVGQEQRSRELLSQLADLPGDSDRFEELLQEFLHGLRAHVAFEDTVLLAVAEHIGADERAAVGRQWKKARQQRKGAGRGRSGATRQRTRNGDAEGQRRGDDGRREADGR